MCLYTVELAGKWRVGVRLIRASPVASDPNFSTTQMARHFDGGENSEKRQSTSPAGQRKRRRSRSKSAERERKQVG